MHRQGHPCATRGHVTGRVVDLRRSVASGKGGVARRGGSRGPRTATRDGARDRFADRRVTRGAEREASGAVRRASPCLELRRAERDGSLARRRHLRHGERFARAADRIEERRIGDLPHRERRQLAMHLCHLGGVRLDPREQRHAHRVRDLRAGSEAVCTWRREDAHAVPIPSRNDAGLLYAGRLEPRLDQRRERDRDLRPTPGRNPRGHHGERHSAARIPLARDDRDRRRALSDPHVRANCARILRIPAAARERCQRQGADEERASGAPHPRSPLPQTEVAGAQLGVWWFSSRPSAACGGARRRTSCTLTSPDAGSAPVSAKNTTLLGVI